MTTQKKSPTAGLVAKKLVKLFVGSSSEAQFFVSEFKRAVEKHRTLKNMVDVVPWTETERWKNGVATIEDVLKTAEEHHMGAFILAHEDTILTRGQVQKLTRPNIWLEIGVFMAKCTPKRTFLLDSGDFGKIDHNPSDLAGITRKSFIASHGLAFGDALKAIELEAKVIYEGLNPSTSKEADFEETDTCKLIFGRSGAYRVGLKLVENSRHVLFSILSFPEEGVDAKQSEMEAKIVKRIKGGGSVVIRRFVDTNVSDFRSQVKRLLVGAKEASVDFAIRHTDCQFIEAIIADDNVLLVIPDYAAAKSHKDDDQVGLGILFSRPEVAQKFKDWFTHMIPRDFTKRKEVLHPELKSGNALTRFLKKRAKLKKK